MNHFNFDLNIKQKKKQVPISINVSDQNLKEL